MDIHVTARKIRIHTAVKEYAIANVIKFEHLFDHLQRCDIIFSKDGKLNDTKVVEIILHINGHFFTAKESSDDYHKSIDTASEKVEHQLVTYKSKLGTRKRLSPKRKEKK
ncbi:MAG: ribosome-associated translation inhibitor RaiA [Ignavibacteriales bacterium]|nr:ribosome-associated translation inhibitor RaiA [Ignavibacteriales bacterium]